jgi:hypothetical protein
MSKTFIFFKWQLLINIEYAYFQPFWCNFYFFNRIFFFFIKQLHILFEFLLKNPVAINVNNNKIIKDKQICGQGGCCVFLFYNRRSFV